MFEKLLTYSFFKSFTGKIIFRQKIVAFDKLLTLVEGCQKLKQNEVILASENDALAKFDISRCSVLKDPLMHNSVALYFRRNHFLVKAIDQKISLYKSAGLIDFWISIFDEDRKKRSCQQSQHLKVLSLYDLSGAFIVWAFGLLISSFFVILETLLIKPLERLRNRFDHAP